MSLQQPNRNLQADAEGQLRFHVEHLIPQNYYAGTIFSSDDNINGLAPLQSLLFVLSVAILC
jgi:hypothetical protein